MKQANGVFVGTLMLDVVEARETKLFSVRMEQQTPQANNKLT